MSHDPNSVSTQPDLRLAAYSNLRTDVFNMVPHTARNILDVGCSNGTLGRSLRAAQSGRVVSGIELDKSFALEAAIHLDHVIQGDLNTLDWEVALAGRSFDCIIFSDVLEHLVEPHLCLLQARSHLQPGGCVIVSLPNIRHLSAISSIFLGGRFPQRDRGIFDRTHLRWFTIADANRLLADCAFIVSDTSLALRWGDSGGGRLNRLLNHLPKVVQQWGPIREFLTYQVCLRGEVAP
ncbi:MAG: methionine biosynthesis protein MetW [Gallionellaceae bacterium]